MPHPSLGELLEFLMWAAGILLGVFYVIQEYKAKPPESLKDNPRIKNLAYVLGGGAIGTLLDWQLVAKSNAEISKGELAIHFAIAAIATIILGFAVLSILVAVQAYRRNNRALPAAKVEVVEAVLLFLSRGYSAYQDRVNAVEEKLASSQKSAISLAPMIQPIVLAMAAERTYVATKQNLRGYTAKILEMIPPYVAAQLGSTAQISTANYMRAIKMAEANKDLLSLLHFTKPPHDGYDYMLVLEQYPQDEFGTHPITRFALPVHQNEDNCLPGAPLAFRQHRWQAVVTSRPQFAPGVPKWAQKEAASYFKKVSFKSFLCVPMIKGGKVVGVVNIESQTDAFDPRDDRIAQVAETLQPFSTTLGSLIG